MKPPIACSRKDKGRCMVFGCKKKAMYHGHRLTSERGYCEDHKALAVRRTYNERRIDFLVNDDE